ncbi:hypothetical protein E2562_019177 [Oryza meyeriana var. granulata]|uniref:Uncharacterized protein n=1 Tax=Oryza meyeriana var. granulata TaxID=110450 RepID=A0A6G1CRU9_9ORYZ|nr:hypothetical protein E2562_019177 [Oryza meyeriana var. granulata]
MGRRSISSVAVGARALLMCPPRSEVQPPMWPIGLYSSATAFSGSEPLSSTPPPPSSSVVGTRCLRCAVSGAAFARWIGLQSIRLLGLTPPLGSQSRAVAAE